MIRDVVAPVSGCLGAAPVGWPGGGSPVDPARTPAVAGTKVRLFGEECRRVPSDVSVPAQLLTPMVMRGSVVADGCVDERRMFCDADVAGGGGCAEPRPGISPLEDEGMECRSLWGTACTGVPELDALDVALVPPTARVALVAFPVGTGSTQGRESRRRESRRR